MKTAINWRIFTTLLVTSLLSVVAVFPYVLTVQADTLDKIGVPIALLFAIQLLQCAVMFSVAIFFGLLLAKKTGFHLPVLEAYFEGRSYKTLRKKNYLLSVILGSIVAIVIYLTDRIFAVQGTGISTSDNLAPAWQKLLASFYGGITEEILMRLFLMTFFVWIGMNIARRKQPAQTGIIISIILAAIIFGLGHLPITAAITTITPLVVLRAIVLNGIGGIVFGWLYWKKGLEMAMIAHFSTDVVLLTMLPVLLK